MHPEVELTAFVAGGGLHTAVVSPTGVVPEQRLVFDHLVGADGERGAVAELSAFPKTASGAGVALAVTCNYTNNRTPAELRLDEVTIAKHFHQVQLWAALALP